MISYYEDYGMDIDGNRSQRQLCYELTNDNTPYIRDEIYRLLREDIYSYDDNIWIQLICPVTEELVDFDVEISSYITKQQFNKLQKDN